MLGQVGCRYYNYEAGKSLILQKWNLILMILILNIQDLMFYIFNFSQDLFIKVSWYKLCY